MRAVEDHHVDRPEMYAQQCVQLTGTNRPTGLIPIRKKTDLPSLPKDIPTIVSGLGTDHVSYDCPRASRRAGQSVCSTGLVALARAKHPIPSRTRPLSAAAPMVLRPKTRESRSPPNLSNTLLSLRTSHTAAGWSSPVARQAHNLKAAGSNPAPATIFTWALGKS